MNRDKRSLSVAAEESEHVSDSIEKVALADPVGQVGARIKRLRKGRGLVLTEVAKSAGISAAMLSMIERAKANPSIGTLLAIANALDVSGYELLAGHQEFVDRTDASAPFVIVGHPGVRRRLLLRDRRNGIEVAEGEYDPEASTSESPSQHTGHEYGVVVDGEITVELDSQRHVLRKGDAIGFDSRIPHRFINGGPITAHTIWFNLFER